MGNESDLQNELPSNTESLAMPMSRKFDAQFRFDTSATLCNFSAAKPIASMPDQSIPTVQVNRDLIGKIPTLNYGYKNPIRKKSPAIGKRQLTARLIKDCQIAFAEMMQVIGNPGAVHQKQELSQAITPGERYSSELSTEIRTILDRQMPITEFGMRWEPNFQVFYGSGKIFANNDKTDTVPTHDLAHLLIGACGNLHWCPEGSHEDVRLAEYNAVIIENILSYVHGHILCGTYVRDTVLYEAVKYARWFVDVHYAPFPIPAEEAYRRFCWNMDVDAIVRLSPLFFALKHVECTVPDYRDQIWELHFNTEDAPPAEQVVVICPDGPLN